MLVLLPLHHHFLLLLLLLLLCTDAKHSVRNRLRDEYATGRHGGSIGGARGKTDSAARDARVASRGLIAFLDDTAASTAATS